MKLFLLVLLSAAILGGCARVKPFVPSTPARAAFRNISPKEQEDLLAGRIRIGEGQLAVFGRDADPYQVYRDLKTRDLTLAIAFVRNPGKWILVLDEKPRYGLIDKDKALFKSAVESAGGKIDEDGQLELKLGPNGRTPIVMPTLDAEIFPKSSESNKRRLVSHWISFNTKVETEIAKFYIDRAYKVSTAKYGDRWALIATRDIREGNLAGDQEAFVQLARDLRGNFETSGYTE